MKDTLLNKLNNRINEGTYRSLSLFKDYTDFYSNDYLGLSNSSTNSFVEKGATGSRLISGNCIEAKNAEKEIASFFKTESALMYNSGYDANIGFFSCIPERGDTVIYDELIHASVRDGIRMSFANSISFKHNDISNLESKLKISRGTIYVAIEGLYSMDGDIPPIQSILNVCNKYGAYLVVDEAHSAGIYGDKGMGLVSALGIEKEVFARLITFGKAYGSHGAVFLGNQNLINYLINFSRSFIYTTALPSNTYNINLNRIKSSLIKERQKKLQSIISYFRFIYNSERLISDINSPIQIIQIGKIEEVKLLAEKFNEREIAIKPIYSPTVPIGNERIRLCFHSFNKESEVNLLVEILNKFYP